MSHDEFTKLYVYLQELSKRIDSQFADQDMKIDTLMGTVDGLAKRIDDIAQEVGMLTYGQRRHDRWFEQLATHTKIALR